MIDRTLARKIAHLPYRQSFYSSGGWKSAPLPIEDSFQFFLNENFSRQDQNRSEKKAMSQSGFENQDEDGFITFWDPAYPILLREIFDPPPVLFFKLYGCQFPKSDMLYQSIVGTRRAHHLCKEVIENLFEKNFFLQEEYWSVSGFALGVDRLVHLASINNGVGSVAVLGSGLGNIGPRRNLDLISLTKKRKSSFLFFSEYPFEVTANPWHFPRRNRIIAGLSKALYCIQAPKKSGAMISARFAMDEGRDVYAFDHPTWKNMPGANEGARTLLEDGAMPIYFSEEDESPYQKGLQKNSSKINQMHFWEKNK